MTETARTTAAADPAAPPPPPARATGTVPQPAHGVPDAPAAPRRLGVEEEFHLVDRVTRRLAPRAPELLDLLSSEDCYVAEMQQCVVETNTAVVDDLPALRNELIARRTRLAEAAAQLGLGIVAAGAVPLALPSEMSLADGSACLLAIRPEALSFSAPSGPAEIGFSGIAGTPIYIGTDSVHSLTLPGGQVLEARIRSRQAGLVLPSPGEPAQLSCPLSAIRILTQ